MRPTIFRRQPIENYRSGEEYTIFRNAGSDGKTTLWTLFAPFLLALPCKAVMPIIYIVVLTGIVCVYFRCGAFKSWYMSNSSAPSPNPSSQYFVHFLLRFTTFIIAIYMCVGVIIYTVRFRWGLFDTNRIPIGPLTRVSLSAMYSPH